MITRADLEAAETDITEWRSKVAVQEQTVAEMRERGQPVQMAESLLKDFYGVLWKRIAHRDQLERHLTNPPRLR